MLKTKKRKKKKKKNKMDIDVNTKLCYLNDKMNKLTGSLQTRINNTVDVLTRNRLIAETQRDEIEALKALVPYTKTETDEIFATKEELGSVDVTSAVTLDTVYTKTQCNEAFVSLNQLQTDYYQKEEVYTKTEADTLFAGDAGLYYTKSEIDSSLDLGSDDIIVKKNLVPSITDTLDIGSPASKFKDLYLSGALCIKDQAIEADLVHGGVSVNSLIVGDDLSGRYKLGVGVVDNKKTLQISDVDNVQDPVNLTILYDLLMQNASDIEAINSTLSNL